MKMNIKVNGKVELIEVSDTAEEIPVECQIDELKQKLVDTDYIACKIAEGVATVEEYAEELKQRQEWREEINRLEELQSGNN
jgi:hypothetical protein